MKQEWKPGDVGKSKQHGYIGIFVNDCELHGAELQHWHNESGKWDPACDDRTPLVVIDPEDRELLHQGLPTDVVEVPPASLKTYATGKGNASKDQVLAAVVRRYSDVDVAGNDEADALVLAAMGARSLGEPIDDMPQTHLRGMAKVAWPVVAA